MKKNMMAIGLTLGLLGTTLLADEVSDATAFEMMGVQSYSPSGYFYQQDFEPLGDNSPFDWAFETPDGQCFELQGNAPTDDNLFGWKSVACAEDAVKSWVMVQVGDTDGDGSGRFDWVMLSTDAEAPAVYKLNGVADNGSFEYSEKMALEYTLTTDENNASVVIVSEPTLEPFDIENLTDQPLYSTAYTNEVTISTTCYITSTLGTPMVDGELVNVPRNTEILVQAGSRLKYAVYTGMQYNLYQSGVVIVNFGGATVYSDRFSVMNTRAPAPTALTPAQQCVADGGDWDGEVCV